MLAKDVKLLRPIAAVDYTELRELLHPDRDAASIGYSLAHAVVGPGRSSLRHRLDAVEVYYFLSGVGVMHVGDEAQEVRAGLAVVVPALAPQWLENTGNDRLEFLCIVDPAWREEQEENLQGGA